MGVTSQKCFHKCKLRTNSAMKSNKFEYLWVPGDYGVIIKNRRMGKDSIIILRFPESCKTTKSFSETANGMVAICLFYRPAL